MAITLEELDGYLQTLILHADAGQDDTSRRYRAIKLALQELIRRCRIATSVTDVTVASGASTFDGTVSINADFQSEDFLYGTINSYPVKVAPSTLTVERRRRGSLATGRPTMIGFRDDGVGIFDKQTDAEYTLKVIHNDLLTDFDVNTLVPGSVSLSVPDDWARRSMCGAKYYLFSGAPSVYPEAGAARAEWDKTLQEAMAYYGVDGEEKKGTYTRERGK